MLARRDERSGRFASEKASGLEEVLSRRLKIEVGRGESQTTAHLGQGEPIQVGRSLRDWESYLKDSQRLSAEAGRMTDGATPADAGRQPPAALIWIEPPSGTEELGVFDGSAQTVVNGLRMDYAITHMETDGDWPERRDPHRFG